MRRIYGALRKWFRGENDAARWPAKRPVKLIVESLENRLAPAGDFRSVIGLDAVQNLYPYQGQGYSIAILDTGIDYNHPALGGGFGAGKRVIAGYDFINNDANPMDDNGHGTHLAGIIGSSNPNMLGIAPKVNLIALKVLDSTNNGTWAAVESALKWVADHQTQYNIVAVNLSLGSGNYTINPYSQFEDEFTTLKSQGVFTAVASGNRFYTYNSQQGLGYPSTSSNVVSVGATWAGDFGKATFSTGAIDYTTGADRIVAFTQRSSQLSLMAPGAWITSTGLNGSTKVMGGTSMATAVVSGSAILLHQAFDATGRAAFANQDNLLALMKSTGVNAYDGDDENDNVVNTGLTFKRVNLKAALDSVALVNHPVTLAPIANQTMQAGQTIQVPLVAADPDNQPITFTYKISYLPALAYQIDQKYALTSSGNYYTNLHGVGEKWLLGAGSQWYCLMPNGELRRWSATMAETLKPANLIATFDASYYADPTKIWNAPAAVMPTATLAVSNSTLSIASAAGWVGTYTIEVTASDGASSAKRAFNVTVTATAPTPTNSPPVLAAIANRSVSHSLTTLVTLSGTDADNDPLTYAARVLPVNGQTPAINVSVTGNQVTLKPTQPLVGTFTIEASVSDGVASAIRNFTLTLTNTGPTLGGITNQTLNAGQTSVNVTINAGDADNDPLMRTATAQTPSATAYQLDQQYGFKQSNASDYFNLQGRNEKWIVDSKNVWYAIMPDGKIYRWTLTMTQTLQAANLIATVDSAFYAQPRLLWDAKPATTPALTFTWSGNQLTIQRASSLTGIYFIDVTVSDGWLSTKKTFQLTLN
jgi:hypothetical protein